jgi:hypothetical protein
VIVILQKNSGSTIILWARLAATPTSSHRNSGVARNMAHELAAKLSAGSGGKNELASDGEAAVP